MNTQKFLVGALVAQVALGVLTWMPRGGTTTEATPLFEGGGNAITSLEISGSGEDAKSVKLESKDGKWLLASASGYPADAEKVGEVLEALGGIELRDPIATQASSQEALGVTDEKFEKKVTVTTSSGEVTFLVGSAESKAIHLRKAGDDDVYKVRGLSAWTLKDTAKGYLPANAVELEKDGITALSITNGHGTIALTRSGDAWELGGDAPEPADAAKVGKLLDAVSRVRLADVVGTTVAPEHGLTGEGTVRVTWTVATGDTTTTGGLVIGAESGSNRYVKVDDSSFVVLAPGYKLKDLVEADPAALAGPAAVAAVDLEEPPTP